MLWHPRSLRTPLARLVLFSTVLILLLTLSAPPTAVLAAGHGTRLNDLPRAAQALVAGTLGREDRAYHLQPTAEGYQWTDSSHGWRADFSSGGLRLASGRGQWTLALQSLGYGDTLDAVSRVAPTAVANRLEYTRGAYTEWYVQGPLGLEQGWTLNAPPAAGRGSIVSLVLQLGGRARLEASGQAVELVDEEGATVLRYSGLSASDATGRELDTWWEWEEENEAIGRLTIQVDDTGAQYPLTIDPYIQQATLTNAGGAANDELGYSVAMSSDGSTIVAGAVGVNSGRGAAYVFARAGGTWATSSSPTATLTDSGGAAWDYLGSAVAMSSDGSTIVVGAYGVGSYRGAAYVFVRPGSSWATTATPTATLTNASGAANDLLGGSVAISADGSTIVVGAGGVNSGRGAAYVFTRSGITWATSANPTATLTNSGGAASDDAGIAVAVSPDGSIIVAGAAGVNGWQGAAYVFVRPGNSWVTSATPTATLTNASGASHDRLGASAAISSDGSTIVAGAVGVDSAQGAAYVFVRPGASWATSSSPIATLTNSGGAAGDHLGFAVAMSSDGATVVVGAYGVNSCRGAAYVFARSGSSWATSASPIATLTNPGAAVYDDVGLSVALSSDGATIVAGADGPNGWRGATYVFYPPSNDANLRSLALSSGGYNPTFDWATTSYTASVASSTASITLTPTAYDPQATIQVRVNGGAYSPVVSGSTSGALPLHVGSNSVEVFVTSRDATTTKTYTVTVTRALFQIYQPLTIR